MLFPFCWLANGQITANLRRDVDRPAPRSSFRSNMPLLNSMALSKSFRGNLETSLTGQHPSSRSIVQENFFVRVTCAHDIVRYFLEGFAGELYTAIRSKRGRKSHDGSQNPLRSASVSVMDLVEKRKGGGEEEHGSFYVIYYFRGLRRNGLFRQILIFSCFVATSRFGIIYKIYK